MRAAFNELSSLNASDGYQSLKDAEAVAMFYLEVLSAFKPNKVAFDMLLEMNPSSVALSRLSPMTQHGLLWLIYVHCSM